MEWFDQISEVIVSWRHRYLVEAVAAVIFLVLVHFVIYPIVQKRSIAAAKVDTITNVGVIPAPAPTSTVTITTGPITTNGPHSGVTVGTPPPPTDQKGKGK